LLFPVRRPITAHAGRGYRHRDGDEGDRAVADDGETAGVRCGIENVLDWAKTRLRSGEKPARWRGHLENPLPKKSKIAAIKMALAHSRRRDRGDSGEEPPPG
jgi:hypothetical protein